MSRVPRVCSCCVPNFSISSLKRNSLCSASLVIRDKFFAMCSSVLSFKRFCFYQLLVCFGLFLLADFLFQRGLLFLVHSFLWTSVHFVLLYCSLCCSKLLLRMSGFLQVILMYGLVRMDLHFFLMYGRMDLHNLAFCSSEDFWLLVSTILPETVSPLPVRVRVIRSTKGSVIAFLCFSGMNFIEILPRLGIHDLSRLISNLSLLNAYTLNSISSDLLVWLLIIKTQHNTFHKILLNSDYESLYNIRVQLVYISFTLIDFRS